MITRCIPNSQQDLLAGTDVQQYTAVQGRCNRPADKHLGDIYNEQ